MRPSVILDALRRNPNDAGAWEALDALLAARAARCVGYAQARRDAAQTVAYKLLVKLRDDTLGVRAGSDGEVVRYLDAMLSNGWKDDLRRDKRVVYDDEVVEGQRALDDTQEEESFLPDDLETARGVFDRVAATMIERLRAEYREGRERAGRQVLELYFSEETVEALVARDQGVDPSDARAVKTAVDRAMKQHQRFREGMLSTADAMRERGTLDEESHRLVCRMVQEMKRR